MQRPPLQLRRALSSARSLARAAFTAVTGLELIEQRHLSDLVEQLTRQIDQLTSRFDKLELLVTGHPMIRSVDAPAFEPTSPMVSISMVTRDRAHCIGDAIRSAQAQSLHNWELIIIDDGSGDDTRNVVAGFSGDQRIRYAWQPPQGLAAARNHSLRLARGAFVAYLDDDNVLYPDFLSAAVRALRGDKGIDCVYGALVSDAHGYFEASGGQRILFESFDREALLRGNFIDMGVIVHRRELIDRYGGMDEAIQCLCDWDFLLRITCEKPAYRLPVLSSWYRKMDDRTLTATRPHGPDYFQIKRKWFTPPRCVRMPRILYLLENRPVSDRNRVEIRCLRNWGVEIQAWSAIGGALVDPPVRVLSGTLDDAITIAKPDILHAASLDTAIHAGETLARAGLPVTVGPGPISCLLAPSATPDWIKRIYCLPQQRAMLGNSPKLRDTTALFDTSLFRPAQAKDRRTVLASCATLRDEDLSFIHRVAVQCTSHRFVILVRTHHPGDCAEQLKARWEQAGVPGDLLVDSERDALVSTYERAGLYLELPNGESSTDVFDSMARAMATGAHVLAPVAHARTAQLSDSGQTYLDHEGAAALIMNTMRWSEEEWRDASIRAINGAFCNFSDELVLRPMFDDWCALLERSDLLDQQLS